MYDITVFMGKIRDIIAEEIPNKAQIEEKIQRRLFTKNNSFHENIVGVQWTARDR